jgi:hypothetical protein
MAAMMRGVKETRVVTDPFENLFRVLVESRYEAPENLAARLKALPRTGTMPPPWATWAAIGLVEYSARGARMVNSISARPDADGGRRSGDATPVGGSSNVNAYPPIDDEHDPGDWPRMEGEPRMSNTAGKVRKTYRFSNDWWTHRAATFFSEYSSNIGWPVRMLKAKGGESRTPAMMAKLIDRGWTLAEWIKRPVVQLV